jgi:acetylornithine deacetylase/succinyl-diaminopimelate desuccinylase-like protein
MTPELEDLFAFLRFPSISTDSRNAGDVRACAGWLVTKLTGMGLETTLHETPRHPVVVAKNAHKPGRKTVLIYGHYDVQPARSGRAAPPTTRARCSLTSSASRRR